MLNFDELHPQLLRTVEQTSLLKESLLAANIGPEYEMHAMSWLLPRHYYASRPSLFRLNEQGDQNLLLMNSILDAVRSVDPHATLAFLAYMNTLDEVPGLIQASDGIFLEITGPSIHTQSEKGRRMLICLNIGWMCLCSRNGRGLR